MQRKVRSHDPVVSTPTSASALSEESLLALLYECRVSFGVAHLFCCPCVPEEPVFLLLTAVCTLQPTLHGRHEINSCNLLKKECHNTAGHNTHNRLSSLRQDCCRTNKQGSETINDCVVSPWVQLWLRNAKGSERQSLQDFTPTQYHRHKETRPPSVHTNQTVQHAVALNTQYLN
jgi:hypothetical protein